jgi:hypothetical protein
MLKSCTPSPRSGGYARSLRLIHGFLIRLRPPTLFLEHTKKLVVERFADDSQILAAICQAEPGRLMCYTGSRLAFEALRATNPLRALIVSTEEAKLPLAFRHWTKHELVPYEGCRCDNDD